ncbi:MAG: hypothetical protein ACLFVP_07990 [Candidatus Bathyarchaeia archaeon]
MKGKIILVLAVLSGVLALCLTIVAAPNTGDLTFEGECKAFFYPSKTIPLPEFEEVEGTWKLRAEPGEDKAQFHATIETEKGDLTIQLVNVDKVEKDLTTIKISGDLIIRYDGYQERLSDTEITYEASPGNLHVCNRIWLDMWGS